MYTFTAIDFETANNKPDSACAIGMVSVVNGEITRCEHQLIQPPDDVFTNTSIHGISWHDVKKAPTFADYWPILSQKLKGIDFVAAHNVSFDQRVLDSSCHRYQIPVPCRDYVCTVRVAREVLAIRPATLDNVCYRLKIPLCHHNAESDAQACAQILLLAYRAGWRY